MYSYLQLKRALESDTTLKKFRVIFNSGAYPFNIIQGKVINRTWTGKIDKQIGARYRQWTGTFKIKSTEDPGYGTLDDLMELMNSNTAANHDLVMVDHMGVRWNVTFVTDFTSTPGTAAPEAINGFYYIAYEINQRDAT